MLQECEETGSHQINVDESLETEPNARHGHIAVHFFNYILVYGGTNYHDRTNASTRVMWLHNIYSEQWRKYIMPDKKKVPPEMEKASAVAIRRNVYMFGGWLLRSGRPTNTLWKMTWTTNGHIVWSKIRLSKNHKSPSPRYGHAAWEYEEKLWIYGGRGYQPDRYLNDFGDFTSNDIVICNNQLLCYNPASKEWTNLNCLGSVPEPRFECAITIAKYTVWMFGGQSSGFIYLDDFYELNMHSFTWTKIQTDQTRPQGQCLGTFNSIFGRQLVLHGGIFRGLPLNDTWIFDLSSQSWRQCKYSADHQRWGHTGINGIDGNIIILGGGKCNPEYKFTFHLQLVPNTLQQLAMKTVCKHRTELELKCLPEKLIAHLDISDIVEEPDNKCVH